MRFMKGSVFEGGMKVWLNPDCLQYNPKIRITAAVVLAARSACTS